MRAKGLTSRLIAGAVGALVLGIPAAALADVAQSTSESSTSAAVTSATTTSTAITPEAASTTTTSEATGAGTPPQSNSTESASSTASTSTTPEVQAQAPQRQTSGARTSGTHAAGAGGSGGSGTHGKSSPVSRRGAKSALPPGIAGRNGAPPPPFSLRTPVSGLPSLFLEAYDVPPFLLPIYQAAGIAYGVPWQVLAAINEVETNYGRDLNVSSAGAEGWMQFLPSEWSQWGVDADSAGYMDPYNPADAIFAAARYLSAAGGAAHIRTAVYAYNHSQAYVESVMLRAQLLGGMPPEMLGAVTDLAEARFPVHSTAHFADGYATGPEGKTLAGTTIYGEPGAPVIAVKDGTVVSIGSSPSLGLHVSLRDAEGDVFTYADLGEVASLYPVLAPRARLGRIASVAARRPASAPRGQAATAGVQPHAPLSMAAVQSGFTFGVVEGLRQAGGSESRRPQTSGAARRRAGHAGSFLEGPERVYLRTLRPGVTVIAGTVLGHLASTSESHILFQVRPGGSQSPLIDPKPLLDSWVALESTGVYSARGESPFQSVSPTAGQALLESRGELQQQVLRDKGIRLASCERREVEAGRIDRRVLATLELLSVSGLQPSVAGLRCDVPRGSHRELGGYRKGDAFDVTAVNGTPIAGHAAPGAVADLIERKLLDLQGTMRPQQIAGPVAYLDARDAVSLPASQALVHVAFPPSAAGRRAGARIATAGAPLAGSEWTALDERLAEIPDPGVPQGNSAAAIPDPSGAQEGAG